MRFIFVLLLTALTGAAAVNTVRVPNGGIQPQVVEKDGVVHLVYFSGDPAKGDIYYVKSSDYGATFSKPLRVNSQPGAAMALGNIRGAQLSVGKSDRVHVAWNGSESPKTPMRYTRMNDAGTGFEPERNLIHTAYGLDGGGSLAADAQGNVFVFWHAPLPGLKGEQNRRVWVVKSGNEGKTFGAEHVAFDKPIGVCGCCGMKAFADAGSIHLLFRSADQLVNRDIWLLTSKDGGQTFQGSEVSHWNIGACVMSSDYFASSPDGLLAAWETEKQAWFGAVAKDKVAAPIAAPGVPDNRKYPVLAINAKGETLFAWTEGMAWKKGGSAAWQVYDKDLHPTGIAGKSAGVPAWSLIAAFARPDGSFTVVY